MSNANECLNCKNLIIYPCNGRDQHAYCQYMDVWLTEPGWAINCWTEGIPTIDLGKRKFPLYKEQ